MSASGTFALRSTLRGTRSRARAALFLTLRVKAPAHPPLPGYGVTKELSCASLVPERDILDCLFCNRSSRGNHPAKMRRTDDGGRPVSGLRDINPQALAPPPDHSQQKTIASTAHAEQGSMVRRREHPVAKAAAEVARTRARHCGHTSGLLSIPARTAARRSITCICTCWAAGT